MSHPLIERSADLQKLKDEGYALTIKDNYLVVEHIPFVNEQGEVEYGALISELSAQGTTTLRPNGHTVWSTHKPRDYQGRELTYLVLDNNSTVAGGHTAICQFSNTPNGQEPEDYYQKFTHYIELIVPHAQCVDANATARVMNPIDSETDNVFHYIDSNTSRAGTGAYAAKLAPQKIAIIGLGGTGAYILDQVAKTPVREIHLYDDDVFSNHNAFRSPGAATVEMLEAGMSKVAYAARQYSAMHRYITPHETRITEATIEELATKTFVFLCIDDADSRRLIASELVSRAIPFIDVGISLEAGQLGLVGVARTTNVYGEHAAEALQNLPMEAATEDIYASNIQMADINMLNAAYAVIAWKQWSGFYYDTRSGQELVAYTDSGLNTTT